LLVGDPGDRDPSAVHALDFHFFTENNASRHPAGWSRTLSTLKSSFAERSVNAQSDLTVQID
jgi:hypothetical protein